MIADTVMGMFELAPKDRHWYKDRVLVGRALDTILDSPLGSRIQYAGPAGEAKKAPDRAAVHALVATGEEEIFALRHAKKPTRVTMTLSIVEGTLKIDARCYAAELAERPTAIEDLATIGIALRNCSVFFGMRVGWVRPLLQSHANYKFERTQPRAPSGRRMMRSGAILDLIDTRFHASGGPGADPAEVRLAASDVPGWVERTEADGLLTLKWARALTDKATLDRACETHEDWIDQNPSTA